MTPLHRIVPGVALVFYGAAFPWALALEAQSPLITEFLAINEDLIADGDGDHSDWIEIYNPADEPLRLEGWYLTDDATNLEKWRFPAIDLQGGDFLIVFASGKDRGGAGLEERSPELHTNFRLKGDGEYLALVTPDGRVAHEYAPGYPPQREDISFGLATPERDGEERYFSTPTPGAANDSVGVAGLVADTKFSVDRGFYTEPFAVEISTETEDAQIRFTLDGTEPTPQRGEIYSGPIVVDRTTVLRAAAFKPDLEPTGVDTQTYIFLEDVVRQDHTATRGAGFPSSWGETSPDYGMDRAVIGQEGEDRYGGKYASTILDDLKAVPTLSIAMNIDDLFGPDGIYTNSTGRGVAWERPTSVELIHPDGRPGFQVDCGIRIQGGAFRNHRLTKKHSLRLLFKGLYGPTKLRFPWFGDEATDRYDTITLRANSNDGWQWEGAGSQPLYVRDSFARATARAMGGVAPSGSFVHLYLNGIYWGLYNPVERPDASFSASYFGGDKDDWDAISNGTLASGSLDAWLAMADMARAGLADAAAYQRIQGRNPDGTDHPAFEDYLDMDNLADYMIANLYVGNTDWPRKNYWVGRHRLARAVADPRRSGFKFYVWDTEWSIGIRSDLSTNRIGVSEGVAVAWPYVRQNAEFRVLFGDHVHRHFFGGGALYVDPSHPEWDPDHPERNVPAARFVRLCDRVERAVVAESARWGDQHRSTPYTRDEHWKLERNNLLTNYFPYRSAVVLAQLRSAGLYPTIEAPTFQPHGGRFTSSSTLLLTVKEGRIYYTLDGTDPRLPGGNISPGAFEVPAREKTYLVPSDAGARILVPRDGSLNLDWTRLDFDDTAWQVERAAVGYERSSGYEDLIQTDLETSMYGQSSSVYLRIPFILNHPAAEFLVLAMKYDDGFIAYLNGQQVVVANAPDVPRWDSLAIRSRADHLARQFQEFDLSEHVGLLRSGINVLAIHGLNHSTTSGDLLFLSELIALEPPASRATTLNETTVVKARAWVDGQWSALSEATFVDTSLRVTEVMYHPEEPARHSNRGAAYEADDYEFVEIENVGDYAVDLAGVRLAGAIDFDFSESALSSLAPGAFLLVVKNLAAFQSLYAGSDLLIAGEYRGNLSNAGENLRLEGPHETTLLDFTYDDAWYPLTDGGGYSLVINDSRGDPSSWRESTSWTTSAFPGGSPGTPDSEARGPAGWQLIGDANQDGQLDISDVVNLLSRFFGPAVPRDLPCEGDAPDTGGNLQVLDANGDGAVDLSDTVSLLSALFTAGSGTDLGGKCIRIEGCATACAR